MMSRRMGWILALAAVVGCQTAELPKPPVEQEVKTRARIAFVGEESRWKVPGLAANAAWQVVGADGQVACQGQATAAGEVVAPATLPPGYWTVRSPGVTNWSFTVTVDPATRTRDPESPFAVDSAFSWVASPSHYTRKFDSFNHVAKLMYVCGFSHTRDRMRWAQVHRAPGQIEFGDYLACAKQLQALGIADSGVFHDAPKWTRTGGERFAGKHGPRDLKALYDFCRASAEQFGDAMYEWEIWNEPEGSLPGWEMSWVVKAAALGYRAGNPRVHVTPPSTVANLDCPYDGYFFKNEIFKYVDIHNVHHYGALHGYQSFSDKALNMLRREGCANVPLVITECGTESEGSCQTVIDGIKCHTPEQELIVADFVPKSQILWQAGGVARNYFFLFGCFGERMGDKAWGILRGDGSAKPAVAAFSTLTAELDGLDCLGLAELPKGMEGALYRGSDGATTLAFWGSGSLSLKTAEPVRAVNWCGTPRTVMPVKGAVTVNADKSVTYLRGCFKLPVARACPKPPEPQRYEAKAGEDMSVIAAVYFDEKDFSITDGGTTSELRHAGGGQAELAIWNLSDRPKRGRVTVANGEFVGLPAEIELPAFGCWRRVMELKVKPNDGDVAVLTVGGTFEGSVMTPTVIRVRDIAAFLGNSVAVEAPWKEDDKWSINTSAPIKSMQREADGSMRFDAEWAEPADRWCYPSLSIPKGLAQRARIVEYEVRSWQDKVENDYKMSNLFAAYTDGGERVSGVMPPVKEWEVRRVGLPPNHDPANLQSISLGGGHPKGQRLKVWFRNVKFYCDPEKGER